MSKTFPKNCTKECPYYHSWDLSIDDYTNVCDKLHIQVDDCDAYGPFYVPILCPLDKKEEEAKSEEPVCLDCGTEIAHYCKKYRHEKIYVEKSEIEKEG